MPTDGDTATRDPGAADPAALLTVTGLRTYFFTRKGVVPAVDNIDLTVSRGRILGLVGESGCGKSITALSLLRLIPAPPGRIVGGTVDFDGRNLLELSNKEMGDIRGNEIAMIFQEPMTSLNPVYPVGRQVAEPLILHHGLSKAEARAKALKMFNLVGIPEPERRIDVYPHELSGGLRQRVMIAMALTCRPKLLIADEPTTALDVTVQAQILGLMKDIQRELDSAIILITHDLGVVAEICDDVSVMYAGQIVEHADVYELFDRPLHPYTVGLLKSLPKMYQDNEKLYSIAGMVPNLLTLPAGCRFHPRCEAAQPSCREAPPPLFAAGGGHMVRCWKYRV